MQSEIEAENVIQARTLQLQPARPQDIDVQEYYDFKRHIDALVNDFGIPENDIILEAA